VEKTQFICKQERCPLSPPPKQNKRQPICFADKALQPDIFSAGSRVHHGAEGPPGDESRTSTSIRLAADDASAVAGLNAADPVGAKGDVGRLLLLLATAASAPDGAAGGCCPPPGPRNAGKTCAAHCCVSSIHAGFAGQGPSSSGQAFVAQSNSTYFPQNRDLRWAGNHSQRGHSHAAHGRRADAPS
jgi:hypothetical protein